MRQTLRITTVKACAVLIMFTLSPLSAATAGAVYQWQDEQGQVVFGDQPPSGVASRRLDVKVEQPGDAAVKEAQRVHQQRMEINQAMEAERKAREAAIAEQRAMQQAIREAQRLRALEEQRAREQAAANKRHYYSPAYPYYYPPCAYPGSHWRCKDDRHPVRHPRYEHDKYDNIRKDWDNNPRAGWFDRDRRNR